MTASNVQTSDLGLETPDCDTACLQHAEFMEHRDVPKTDASLDHESDGARLCRVGRDQPQQRIGVFWRMENAWWIGESPNRCTSSWNRGPPLRRPPACLQHALENGDSEVEDVPYGTYLRSKDSTCSVRNISEVWTMARVARASNETTANGRQWTRIWGQSTEWMVEPLFAFIRG